MGVNPISGFKAGSIVVTANGRRLLVLGPSTKGFVKVQGVDKRGRKVGAPRDEFDNMEIVKYQGKFRGR